MAQKINEQHRTIGGASTRPHDTTDKLKHCLKPYEAQSTPAGNTMDTFLILPPPPLTQCSTDKHHFYTFHNSAIFNYNFFLLSSAT